MKKPRRILRKRRQPGWGRPDDAAPPCGWCGSPAVAFKTWTLEDNLARGTPPYLASFWACAECIRLHDPDAELDP
jgi:hypothetical protein